MKLRTWFLILPVLFTKLNADVNESTGQMYLSHPLFTISGNSLSLPITLGYQAGIKIDQRAGWVGLGFGLSLPYVERVPNGSADEKTGQFLCNGQPNGEPWFYAAKTFSKLIRTDGNGYKPTATKGDFTNQQDIYLLNAHFANGRIVFEQPTSTSVPMKAHLQNWRPIKIEYKINGSDDIYEWDFTDESGVKYIFGGQQGIVKVTANIAFHGDNTAITLSGTNGTWNQALYTDLYGNQTYVPARMPDHYVNASFNRRWYLTEIQSPGYNGTPGTGERIIINYTTPQAQVRLADLFYFCPGYRPATSLFKYTKNSNTYASFTFHFDNYYINPVYPTEIIGPRNKATFFRSASSDKLIQGDQKIDKIELYTMNNSAYQLTGSLRFGYDPNGHCVGHPYSISGKGLLKLDNVRMYSADGVKWLPIIAFTYPMGNPSFGNDENSYYRHDIFGYYNKKSLRDYSSFYYANTQSIVGTLDDPCAIAWSVYRVTYGSGKTEEYGYETNKATLLSTNQSFTDASSPLNPGIRVKMKKEYDGVSSTPITTNYEYSDNEGYVAYTTALDPSLSALYTNLYGIGNIMLLNSVSVQYAWCKKSIEGAGSIKTYFLTPAKSLPKYEITPISNLSLADVKVTNSEAINSKAHYRGMPWLKEIYKQGTTTNPISTITYNYAINYNLATYSTGPDVEMNTLITCQTGENGSATAPDLGMNDIHADLIGFVRPTGSVEVKDKVAITKEIVSYNNTNGQTKITRTANSDGKKLLTKTFYAFENPFYAPCMGVNGAYMLTAPCQTITYEKAPADNTTEPAAANVRSVQATMWSNTLGCASWVPWKTFAWRSNFNTDGTIGKTNFTNFTFPTSETDTNWNLTGCVDKYDPSGIPLQTSDAYGVSSAVILSGDTKLPIATVANAKRDECIFTNWAESDPVTVNNCSKAMESGASNLHFASRSLKITKTVVSGDQFAVIMTTPVFSDGSTIGGKKYTIQFWAKSDLPSCGSQAFVQGYGSWVVPSWNNFTVTTAWQKYSFTAEFPASATDKQYRLVVRPPMENISGNVGKSIWFDDIRVFPANGLATTTYYDPKWQLPILTVDPNFNPGRLVVYDDFGRAIQWWKVDMTKGKHQAGYRMALVQTRKHELTGECGAGEVKLLSPPMNDPAGATVPIMWTADKNISCVSLEYSLDNGATWTYVVNGRVFTPSDADWGNYRWSVPAVCLGKTCKIKVTNFGSPSYFSVTTIKVGS